MSTTKAWVAALVAALASLVATVQGRTDLDTMGAADWLVVIASALVAGGTVWAAPNKDRKGQRQQQSVQPPTDPLY